jgi:hypothetical protein
MLHPVARWRLRHAPSTHAVLLALLAIVLWFAGAPAHAQATAVKCGRVYQDRPCAAGGRLIAPTRAQKGMRAAHPVDPACQRRATEAGPIIAARAQGVPETQQRQEAGGDVARLRLIEAVYATSGPADAQRNALIAGCSAERDALLRARMRPAAAHRAPHAATGKP